MQAGRGGFALKDLADVTLTKRTMKMYYLHKGELDTLRSGHNSIHLSLCGMSFGVLVTTGAALFSDTLIEHSKIFFFSALLISGFATLYFGLMAWSDRTRADATVQEIIGESQSIVDRARKPAGQGFERIVRPR